MKALKEKLHVDDEKIYRGIIKEMANYDYVEEYIGRFLVKIYNILEGR